MKSLNKVSDKIQKFQPDMPDYNNIKESYRYKKILNDLVAKAGIKLENKIYFKRGIWKDLIVLALAAFVTTIAMDYFISATGKTGLFPSGLSTIARFAAILTFEDKPDMVGSFYFVYYLLLNIPFIIFGVIKLGYKFSITTLIFISMSLMFDQILNLIPVINPVEWKVIIDYTLIQSIPGEWSSGIWLFIFGITGGIILGWAYSQTYRVASSTGGVDFISMYIAKKYNKNIGKINMKINFCILLLVIILNTATIGPSDISQSVKYSVLNNEITTIDQLNNFLNTHNVKDLLDDVDTTNIQEVLTTLSKSKEFTDYDSNMIFLMRAKFIFGPTLFGSAIMIICQAVTTDHFYPKNKVFTMMITTTKADDVKEFLFESGYKNNVFIWQTRTWKKSIDVDDKKVLMVQMTTYNWKKICGGLLELDRLMNVNIVRTSKIEGPFAFALDDEKMQSVLRNKILCNDKTMRKLEEEALIKFKRKSIRK